METTQTSQDNAQNSDRTDSTCIICGDEARFYCARCKEVKYCSHECADADANVHDMVCPEIENFKTSRRRKTVRAIAFRHDETKPEFIWLSRFNDKQRTKAMVGLMEGMHRLEPYVIDSNIVRNRKHETIFGFVLQKYRDPFAPRNKNMRVLIKSLSSQILWEKRKYPWFGTTIFVAVKSGIPDFGDDLRDFTVKDFRNLCDWLSLTLTQWGGNAMTRGIKSNQVSRTQKVKGVHVRAARDGKLDFAQIFFPRDYPFSFQRESENDPDSDDSTETERRKFRRREESRKRKRTCNEDNQKEIVPKETPPSPEVQMLVSSKDSQKDSQKEIDPEETPPSAETRILVSESVGLTLVAVLNVHTAVSEAKPKIKPLKSDSSHVGPGWLHQDGVPRGLESLQRRELYEIPDWEEPILLGELLTDSTYASFYRKDLKDLLPQHMEVLCEFVRSVMKSSAKGKDKEVDPGMLCNKDQFERYWQQYTSKKGWHDIQSPYTV